MENSIIFEVGEPSDIPTKIKSALRNLLLQKHNNIKIKGTKHQVRVFGNALIAEKNYIQNAINYGKESAISQKSKLELDRYLQEFQDVFGVSWPIE